MKNELRKYKRNLIKLGTEITSEELWNLLQPIIYYDTYYDKYLPYSIRKNNYSLATSIIFDTSGSYSPNHNKVHLELKRAQLKPLINLQF